MCGIDSFQYPSTLHIYSFQLSISCPGYCCKMRVFMQKSQPHLAKYRTNWGYQNSMKVIQPNQINSAQLNYSTLSTQRCSTNPRYFHYGCNQHLYGCSTNKWIKLYFSSGHLESLIVCTVLSSLLHPRPLAMLYIIGRLYHPPTCIKI